MSGSPLWFIQIYLELIYLFHILTVVHYDTQNWEKRTVDTELFPGFWTTDLSLSFLSSAPISTYTPTPTPPKQEFQNAFPGFLRDNWWIAFFCFFSDKGPIRFW